MGISNLAFSATNINVGLDADKSATPRKGDLYLATDTEILYRCYADDSWVSDELTEAKIDAVKANISKIASGSYAGDDTVNRAIAHGLIVKPKYVHIQGSHSSINLIMIIRDGHLVSSSSGSDLDFTVTTHDATNFYVGYGTGGDLDNSANGIGFTYYWTAWV